MYSPLFVFLGVTEKGTNIKIRDLKDRLESILSNHERKAKFEEKGDLLVITLSQPHFSFYVSFVNNDRQTLADWKAFAKNFGVPWEVKTVDKRRLEDMYAYLEAKEWPKYGPTLKLGFVILEEIEKFRPVKVFTIPYFATA